MKVGYQILADLQQQQAFKQWGNSWSGYTGVFNWYFPISPSQVYAACLTKHTKNISSSHNWEPARVEEWNNSYARIHPDGDLGYSVIAICKAQQQWGKILGDTVNLKIINFPVSFNECFGGLALFNGDPVAAAEYATITDITNTNFKIYMYANNAGTGYANANIFYLFLGAQQQWGMNIHGWVIFPIPFTKFRRLVTNHQGNVFMDSKARESNTLSGFTLDVADNSDQNKDAQWIAIGA